MSYLLLKWVHIMSATILFGTGIGSAFYMFMANRRGKVEEIFYATRMVVLADYLFTAPAVILQFITGVMLVHKLGYNFSDFWIAWGMGLYFFAGACWLPVVWMQIRMRNMAKKALVSGELLPESFWKMDRWWILLGSLAFPSLVGVFYLMVFKPLDLAIIY